MIIIYFYPPFRLIFGNVPVYSPSPPKLYQFIIDLTMFILNLKLILNLSFAAILFRNYSIEGRLVCSLKWMKIVHYNV